MQTLTPVDHTTTPPRAKASPATSVPELHDLPDWKLLAETVKTGFRERSEKMAGVPIEKADRQGTYPSTYSYRGDYSRTQARRAEEQFIDAAVRHTVLMLNHEENLNGIYPTFLRRELAQGVEQLQRHYEQTLYPPGLDEWSGMDQEGDFGTARKFARMDEVHNRKQGNAREKLDAFLTDVERDIRKTLRREHQVSKQEIRYRLHEKGIEDPTSLPFVTIVQQKSSGREIVY